MKIGIDARMIEHAGIGRYTSSLLSAMLRLAPSDEFILFGEPSKLKKFLGYKNARVVEVDIPIYSPWEQVIGPIAFRGIDVLHVPHFNIPLLFKGGLVVTIHDLIYLVVPGSAPSDLGKRYARFMISEALKKADKLITMSEYTKKDVMKHFGARYGDKITVIPGAASTDFKHLEDRTKITDVRCRYRLGDNIILYVGNVKPHKNVGTLIDVFEKLKEWGIPHQLVICGKWDEKEDRLKEKIDNREIMYLGEIPGDDLVALYNSADVLVHLSKYEGFGLTVLEAMQCGTPVIVSDATSLPEVAGKAAYSVSPDNIEQIADTVYNVLVNLRLREGMAENGINWAKQFSWEKAAAETLDVYRSVSRK